jgi:hypothetical protein
MTERTIVEFPKGLKATIYRRVPGGAVWLMETIFLRYAIAEKYARREDCPFVYYRSPRKRRVSHTNGGYDWDRFLVVAEGWGYPPTSPPRIEWPIFDRIGYPPYLRRVHDEIVARCDETRHRLLVDVYDACHAPPRSMDEEERTRLLEAIVELWDEYSSGAMTTQDLKVRAAHRTFTVPGEAGLMLEEPSFRDWFDRTLEKASVNGIDGCKATIKIRRSPIWWNQD